MLLLGTEQARRVVRFGNLLMWAERGLVRLEDTRTGAYKVESVRTMLQRMRALSDMIGNSKRHRNPADPLAALMQEHVGMLESMVEVCRRAQEQGTPDDPTCRTDLALRRPCTVVVPAGGAIL